MIQESNPLHLCRSYGENYDSTGRSCRFGFVGFGGFIPFSTSADT